MINPCPAAVAFDFNGHRLSITDSNFDRRLAFADPWLRTAPRNVADAFLCATAIVEAPLDLNKSLEMGDHDGCAKSITQLPADVRKLASCLAELGPSVDAANHVACQGHGFIDSAWIKVALKYGERLQELIFDALFSAENCELTEDEEVWGLDLKRMSSIDGHRVRDGLAALEIVLQDHLAIGDSDREILVASIRQEMCRLIVTPGKEHKHPKNAPQRSKSKTPTEVIREQRNKFSKPRREKGMTWQAIYDEYAKKYPLDTGASGDAMRLSSIRDPAAR